MSADLAHEDSAALEHIVRRLESAWNAMDGPAFAAAFAAEADFVNIRGEHFRGKADRRRPCGALPGHLRREHQPPHGRGGPPAATRRCRGPGPLRAGYAPWSVRGATRCALQPGPDERARRMGDRRAAQYAGGSAGAGWLTSPPATLPHVIHSSRLHISNAHTDC